ncbi:hypothetical protein C8C88_1190 [Flavobacterium sp. 123]|nr:hypothetical protein C8C88_1190 [Flavobacterium sp. 123]
MNLKQYKPLLSLLLLVVGSYLIHKTIFLVFKFEDTDFYYSLETLYLLFFSFSVVIMLVLLKIKQRSFDNVGISFLLATSIKMILCFIILRPLLKVSNEINALDKKNFFVTFILFLTIETMLTIRILGKKQ